MNQLNERYLEDFAVGQTFGSGRLRIDGERALAFAAEFDPQPFHLDEAAARRSIFRGLTASGWHTAAVTMRLLVGTELKPAGGLIGALASTSAVGPGPCAPVTSCASSAR
jgi:acyl dehydratase